MITRKSYKPTTDLVDFLNEHNLELVIEERDPLTLTGKWDVDKQNRKLSHKVYIKDYSMGGSSYFLGFDEDNAIFKLIHGISSGVLKKYEKKKSWG